MSGNREILSKTVTLACVSAAVRILKALRHNPQIIIKNSNKLNILSFVLKKNNPNDAISINKNANAMSSLSRMRKVSWKLV